MPEMSRMVEIWIFAGLGVMVLLFLMSGMARLYRKAGPHEALIVYGLGGTRVCLLYTSEPFLNHALSDSHPRGSALRSNPASDGCAIRLRSAIQLLTRQRSTKIK